MRTGNKGWDVGGKERRHERPVERKRKKIRKGEGRCSLGCARKFMENVLRKQNREKIKCFGSDRPGEFDNDKCDKGRGGGWINPAKRTSIRGWGQQFRLIR